MKIDRSKKQINQQNETQKTSKGTTAAQIKPIQHNIADAESAIQKNNPADKETHSVPSTEQKHTYPNAQSSESPGYNARLMPLDSSYQNIEPVPHVGGSSQNESSFPRTERSPQHYESAKYSSAPSSSQSAADNAITSNSHNHDTKKKKKALKWIIIVLIALIVAAGVVIGLKISGAIGQSSNLSSNGLDKEQIAAVMQNQNMEAETVPETLPNEFYCLLLGVDSDYERSEGAGAADFGGAFRTDSIILAHVNLNTNQVALCSFHRDLKVYINGYGDDNKLNAAYVYGGVDLTIAEIKKIAGIDSIPYYAVVDMDGLSAIIDAAGGIDMEIEKTFYDEDAGGGLDAGWQHLNGEQALIYCRSRHAWGEDGDGDTIRAGHQRDVIKTLAVEVAEKDAVSLGNIVMTALNYVATNFTADQIVELAKRVDASALMENMVSMMTPTKSVMSDEIWFEILDPDRWYIIKQCLYQFKETPPILDEYIDPYVEYRSTYPGFDLGVPYYEPNMENVAAMMEENEKLVEQQRQEELFATVSEMTGKTPTTLDEAKKYVFDYIGQEFLGIGRSTI